MCTWPTTTRQRPAGSSDPESPILDQILCFYKTYMKQRADNIRCNNGLKASMYTERFEHVCSWIFMKHHTIRNFQLTIFQTFMHGQIPIRHDCNKTAWQFDTPWPSDECHVATNRSVAGNYKSHEPEIARLVGDHLCGTTKKADKIVTRPKAGRVAVRVRPGES